MKKENENGLSATASINLKIEGMTCPSCVTGIEKKVDALAGVVSHEVNYQQKKGAFLYDPQKIDGQEIAKAIEELNYLVSEEGSSLTKTQKLELEIEGMTCTSCATSIEKQFDQKKGILSKAVSFEKHNASFVFDTDAISEEEIIATINRGNFKVKAETDNGQSITGESYAYDLIAIGGGSAAFSAATTANEMGLKSLIVNAGVDLGGTCVNIGCVPSKHLMRTAEQIHRASHSPFQGVSSTQPKIDFTTIIKQKKTLVAQMQKKKYLDVVGPIDNIEVLEGWAKFIDKHTIEVNGKTYQAKKFLIATGASTNVPEVEGLKESGYLTTESLFDLEEAPEHLIVLGAGYIALETAQTYRRLGIEVTLLQRSERILKDQQKDLTDELTRYLSADGVDIHTNISLQKVKREGEEIIIETNKGQFQGSHLLVATGTKPNSHSLATEKAGIELTDKGYIKVNASQQTNQPHIYAAGDCTNTPAYVYTAAKEGKVAIQNAFENKDEKVNYKGLPWVVFTDPQVAGAGMDERQAEEAGIPYETSLVPLSEIPKAAVALDTRGFIKLIRNPQTDQLIGARILAPEGGELAMQASQAIRYGISVKELADAFHPYLTLSEGIKLAAITFNKDVAELSCCAT